MKLSSLLETALAASFIATTGVAAGMGNVTPKMENACVMHYGTVERAIIKNAIAI